jgi:hypothetical protein
MLALSLDKLPFLKIKLFLINQNTPERASTRALLKRTYV